MADRALQIVDARTASAGAVSTRPDHLVVEAAFSLSEAGRKASLLAGGNGRAHQRLTIDVPVSRLHLVHVDHQGTARLSLRPWFETGDDHRVVRHDTAPTYDIPPNLEDLFRHAARNYELAQVYERERAAWRSQRAEERHDKRSILAQAFFADPTQRAVVHPPPSTERCYLETESARVLFDRSVDVGLAKTLPAEAHRRFRTDLAAQRRRNMALRVEQLALHEAKKTATAAWIASHGSAEQRLRHEAGVLPIDEVIEAIADETFVALKDHPIYARTGAAQLQEYLRGFLRRDDMTVSPLELEVATKDSVTATAAQWSFVQHIQTLVPDARVRLRQHRLSWRREPRAPALVLHAVLVTQRTGPFTMRREFAVPGA